MRYIIWSVRGWFCKHEFEYSESWHHITGWNGNVIERQLKVSATCKHCGWHRKYKKF